MSVIKNVDTLATLQVPRDFITIGVVSGEEAEVKVNNLQHNRRIKSIAFIDSVSNCIATKFSLEVGTAIIMKNIPMIDAYYQAEQQRHLRGCIFPENKKQHVVCHYDTTVTIHVNSLPNRDITLVLEYEYYDEESSI